MAQVRGGCGVCGAHLSLEERLLLGHVLLLLDDGVELLAQLLAVLHDLHVLKVLAHQVRVLGLDLLLQLVDLPRHDFELALHLCDLVLRLDQILGIQVAVGAHRLIQVLLLLELRLALGDLLLQLQHSTAEARSSAVRQVATRPRV